MSPTNWRASWRNAYPAVQKLLWMSGTFADVLVIKPWHTNGVAKSSQCELESYAMAYHQQASSIYMVVQIAEVIMIPEILSLRQIGRFSVVSGVNTGSLLIGMNEAASCVPEYATP